MSSTKTKRNIILAVVAVILVVVLSLLIYVTIDTLHTFGGKAIMIITVSDESVSMDEYEISMRAEESRLAEITDESSDTRD